MAFLLNVVGIVVFVAGLGWVATMMGVPQGYVAVGALVLLALGVTTAVGGLRARRHSAG